MGKKLRNTVHVRTEDGRRVALKAGTEVPKEFEDLITNPKAFDNYDPADHVDPYVVEKKRLADRDRALAAANEPVAGDSQVAGFAGGAGQPTQADDPEAKPKRSTKRDADDDKK